NCTVTRTLRGNAAIRPILNDPFKTFTGWKDERNKAGYKPANKPVTKVKAMPISQNVGEAHGMVIFFPAMVLNDGKAMYPSPMARINASSATKMDSLKNWMTSCPRTEPIDLRMPTSFERF